MSTQDFQTNNEDPTQVLSGRGLRSRSQTTQMAQFQESLTKQTDSLARRRANAAQKAQGSTTAHVAMPSAPPHPEHTPATSSSPPVLERTAPIPTMEPTVGPPFQVEPNCRQPDFPVPSHDFFNNFSEHGFQPNDDVNAFQAHFPQLTEEQWQTLYTIPGANGMFDYMPDKDEQYGEPEGSSPSQAPLPQANPVAASSSATAVSATTSTLSPAIHQTPPNHRVFPQESATMSFMPVTLKRKLPRRAPPINTQSGMPSSPSEPAAMANRPLVRRANVFGPGLHDTRQRPVQTTSHRAMPQGKENMVELPDTEQDEPPKKKSRKEPDARSIANIAPLRRPVIMMAYDFVRVGVLTDETKFWINDSTDLAVFAQDSFDSAAIKLALNPDDFSPVTDEEIFLLRERTYGTRKDLRMIARSVIIGPDGYPFVTCSATASQEMLASTAAANRALVESLLDRSAFVFADYKDRTIKGSMYRHASIRAVIEKAFFKTMLSDGIQFAEDFDDSFPENADDANDHTPTFSDVAFSTVLTVIKSTILEWSSGHWLSHAFTRATYQKEFVAELKTFRAWQAYTSSPTVLEGNGPTRTLPPSWMARTLKEAIISDARHKLFKDVVAPVPVSVAMDYSDFALNQ